MKNNKYLLISLLACVMSVTSCNESTESVSDSSSDVSSSVQTGELAFENKTFEYDGQPHSIEVANLPAGATVTYKDNGKVDPGTYKVYATITYADGKTETINARMIIKRKKVTISADANQTITVGSEIAYQVSNESAKTSSIVYNRPGTYVLDLYAFEDKYCFESNHLTVNVTVVDRNALNIKFESKTEKFSGQQVELVASDIPSGYHAEYLNNKGTACGKYNAVCKVFDENNNLQYSLNAILTIDNEDYEPFNEYLEEFFADYLDNDYLTQNIFCENPENFGINRDDDEPIHWYTYEHMDETTDAADYQELQGYYDLLLAFEDQPLSAKQKISYRRIDEYFQEYLALYDPTTPYSFLMSNYYIDQFGGYAADFTTYMEAYEFRRVQDIEDCLDYIESLPTAFASYYLYGQEKAQAGYGFSDFTISEMIKFLDGVTEQGEDYYLAEYMGNKVDECIFLDDAQKATYKQKFVDDMADYFMPAYSQLADDLVNLKGNVSKEGYLAAYGDDGQAQYLHELELALGYKEIDPVAYEKEISSALKSYIDSLMTTLTKADASLANGTSIIGIEDPVQMIEFLEDEFAPTIVPSLKSKPEISIKYMDEVTAESSNAVAYYMKSALDSTDEEHITLNGVKLGDDYNDALSTLCHEGYPGHLYAYLFDKEIGLSDIGTIMTSTAHGEGWATYTELKLWEYLKENYATKDSAKAFCDYQFYNCLCGFLLYAYYDFEVHYNHWTYTQVGESMDKFGYNSAYAEEIFRTVIEMPAGYAPYGFGIHHFYQLHEKAKKELGSCYDEVECNTVFLSHGWCPFYELDEVIDEYIADTKFLYSNQDNAE